MIFKIKKVVIPAAGFGTRFLPQTKAMPKEMLPIVDKPVIHYVVREAVLSGIKNIIIVSGYHKRAIEDYFDNLKELEYFLREKGKEKELRELEKIAKLANFTFVRQKSKFYGNAIPVLQIQHLIEDEFFGVMWGDDFVEAHPPRLLQMIEVFEKYKGAVVCGIRIFPKEKVSQYGVGEIEKIKENVYRLKRIVEKPSLKEAPSNLGIIGAYILPPEIFPIIKNLKPGQGNEIWLANAIQKLIQEKFPVYVVEIKNAKYYDTGNKLEYLKTVVDFGLKHPEFGKEFKKYLKKIAKKI